MKDSTQAVLNSLRLAEWFSRVGLPIENSSIERVESWDQAIQYLEGPEWYRVSQVAPNALTATLASRFSKRFTSWNLLVGELLPAVEEIVNEKIANVIQEHGQVLDEDIFRGRIEWDLLHACMEQEYADLVPPGFFSRLTSWYVAGHLPCGWSGTFPTGALIVF